MRSVGVVVLLVACGSSRELPDAAMVQGCPARPPEELICPAQCGNGQIDSCFYQLLIGCHGWLQRQELCDSNTLSCTELGFYGGTAPCGRYCAVWDTTPCDACAPTDLQCSLLTNHPKPTGIAVSGNKIALTADSSIEILDGFAHESTIAAPGIDSIVATADGWLVAYGPEVVAPISLLGVLGTPQPVPNAVDSVLAASNDHALAAYTSGANVEFAMLDLDGNRTRNGLLFTAHAGPPSATSDGTSFFVPALGKLARIASDGSVTTALGYPSQANAADDAATVTWSGTTGWYVSRSLAGSNALSAQRFDTMGAPVGTALTMTLDAHPIAFLADGSDLLVLTFAARKYSLVKITAAGQQASVEVGVGDAGGLLDRIGNDILVVWPRDGHTQLATVAPP